MRHQIKSAAIIGCGWFGLPLAQELVSKGIRVIGTRRSSESLQTLQEQDIEGLVLDLSKEIAEPQKATDSLKTDLLIVSIPPGFRYGNNDYLIQLTRLIALINEHVYQRIVFISTTGVYPNEDKLFDETAASAHSPSASILLQAEALFLALANATVCRFAGLVGPKRHPGRFLAGKLDVSGANASVNIVHQHDCVQAVMRVLSADKVSDTYNVCAPHHLSKRAFYSVAAKSLGLAEPMFNDNSVPNKRIDGSKLVVELGFSYRYSDPMAMLADC